MTSKPYSQNFLQLIGSGKYHRSQDWLEMNKVFSSHKPTDQLSGKELSPPLKTHFEKNSNSKINSESRTKQNSDPVESNTLGKSELVYKTDEETTDFSGDCFSSIQLFRSMISSMTGGDGRGYPDIEKILAGDPGTRELVLEATREYCQENFQEYSNI